MRLFGDRVLRLALGAHEEHDLALGRQVLHKFRRFLEHLQRLLQVDDVDPVALSEDVFLHLGIPALGLMPEVNTRFEQLLHGDVSQSTSSFGLHPSRRPEGCSGLPFPSPRCEAREELNTSNQLVSCSVVSFHQTSDI